MGSPSHPAPAPSTDLAPGPLSLVPDSPLGRRPSLLRHPIGMESPMNQPARPGLLSSLALAVVFAVAGCHGNQSTDTSQTPATEPASDPGSANLAPVSATSTGSAPSSGGDYYNGGGNGS